MLEWLGVILVLIGIVTVFVINSLGLLYYGHTEERSRLAIAVTLVGVSISQLSIVIIPLDVYITSSLSLDLISKWSIAVAVSYYTLFILAIIMCCCVIPFTFFYTEATFLEDADYPVRKKIQSALKFSGVSIVIVAILFIVGLFLHTNHIAGLLSQSESENAKIIEAFSENFVSPFSRQLLQYNDSTTSGVVSNDTYPIISSNSTEISENTMSTHDYIDDNTVNAYNYLNDLLNKNVIEYSIGFTYFAVTGIGFILFWLTYTSLGMSAVGIFLLKGTKRIDDEIREIQQRLDEIQEFSNKYSNLPPKKGAAKVKKQLEDNAFEQEQLQTKLQYLDTLQSDVTKRRLNELKKPFSFLLGVVILLVSLIILTSIAFTQVDRFFSSDCGFSCGFVMTSAPLLLNPIDLLLTYSSMYFPLDVMIFTFIVVFVLGATFTGILTGGIRFLWIKMFSVRPKKTVPQAMVLVALILMLCSLCLMLEILVIAPQYATFGSRTFYNENKEEQFCNMGAGPDACPMTVIAQIVNRFYASLSIVGVAFYIGSWVFIATCLAGIAVTVWLSKRKNTEHIDADDEEDDTL